MAHRRLLSGIFCCLLLLILPSCGGGDPLKRQAVSGTVTLDGQPLDQGTIEFVPANDGQGPGIFSGGLIVGGEFSIKADQGLPPATYTIRISSADLGSAPVPNEAPLPGEMAGSSGDIAPSAERIPAKYNAASELTADVVAGANNRFTFELSTN
jgi:hypothetical protein